MFFNRYRCVLQMEFFHRVLQNLHRPGDGDVVDNLSATATVTAIVVSALVISAKQYVGQPIQCWVPAHFTSAMEQYAENYCYVQNTYWIGDVPADIPQELERREQAQLNYYQWVPFVLLGQAALFYLPRLVWRTLSSASGNNFYAFHSIADSCVVADAIRADHFRHALATSIIITIQLNHWALSGEKFRKKYRLTAFATFIFVKCLYLLNALGQLFLLNAVLGFRQDGSFGADLWRNLISGTDWASSGFFPRITLCDFQVRALGNVHRHTVQCVLNINMFNEKIYAALWLWTLIVASATVGSILFWLCVLCRRQQRRRFVLTLIADRVQEHNGQCVAFPAVFVDNYLGVDGVFVLRTIHGRVGAVLTSQLTESIYENFIRQSLFKKFDFSKCKVI